MARLRCESENHRGDPYPDAVVTRCVRCRKPTCSTCEGTDNGFRDICDRCWCVLDFMITAAIRANDHALARMIIRKWAARARYHRLWPYRNDEVSGFRYVCWDYGLET